MYTIDKIEKAGLSYVVVKGEKAFAEICLDRGAALETLILNSETIIENLNPLEYKDTYASSILFPFANRIKDGKYTYGGKDYQFDCNETGLNNALHGLVFDKTFAIEEADRDENGASLTLKYKEHEKNIGFPYLYTVFLKFVITDANLTLQIEIENNDVVNFPYTLGWHPYFVCQDLSKSTLEFSSSKTVIFSDRMITTDVVDSEVVMPFEIKNKQLDNCYALNEGTVVFNTPSYKMTINSDADENYFQMYTPPRANTIALEPVTGISDSFNNQHGLKELQAGMSCSVVWELHIE